MARKILLADDSVTAQNMGRKILTDAGYEVVTVNNGSAALKKIVECKPSVVVLDVYMPGYSGLEVCARIKEGRDTEGIPVLLTVGKLEPFRHEDARKVNADAFIIKPFEATELLAALGKLEAKAGNRQSEPSAAEAAKAPAETKSSKHVAATMARYEREVADGAPRFGDHESGWKARLTMPSPGSRRDGAAPEPEVAGAFSQSTQDEGRESGDRPAFAVTPPPSDSAGPFAGIPHDVTPDEMAAIAAAAAAVGGSNNTETQFDHAAPESAATAERSESPEPAPATFASEATPQIEEMYSSSSAGPVSAQVEAVFTSFAAAHSSQPGDDASEMVVAPSRETMAGASSSPGPIAARWVAEEVPVEPNESTLVLEREMHKAFAAFAAAEHSGAYEPGPVDKSDEPIFARSAPPAIGAPAPFPGSAQLDSEPNSALEPQLTPAPMQSSDNQALPEAAKPPAMPFAPITSEEPKHAVVAFGEPHPFGAAEPSEPETGWVEAEKTAASPSESTPSATPAASLPDDWHDLRQPVASGAGSNGKGAVEHFSSEQESSTGEIENKVESAAMAAAASSDSSSSTSNDSALSNIVDSMLAELKPKLMAELAKKLEKK